MTQRPPSDSWPWLIPVGEPIPYDEELRDIVHDILVGISGLPNEYVRPAWQPTPPVQLPAIANWLAFAIKTTPAEDYPADIQSADPDSQQSIQIQHEVIDVLLSFYGPRGGGYCARTKAGLYQPSNRGKIRGMGLHFVNASDLVYVPELTNAQWINRVDMPIEFRRITKRVYEVRDIVTLGDLGPGFTAENNPFIDAEEI